MINVWEADPILNTVPNLDVTFGRFLPSPDNDGPTVQALATEIGNGEGGALNGDTLWNFPRESEVPAAVAFHFRSANFSIGSTSFPFRSGDRPWFLPHSDSAYRVFWHRPDRCWAVQWG